MKRSEAIRIFSVELWLWFKKNKRILPWRDLKVKNVNQRAYLVLVSEVMLQQTQVPRVEILYKKFIQIFPHLQSLSKASNAEILRAWKGLGYNSRALRLRDAAKTIVEKHNGQFPRGLEELQSIKGIGEYTAGAIRNFAFDMPTLCIDVNIRRILHRFFVGIENADGTFKKSDRELSGLLHLVMDTALSMKKGTAKDFYAALMDFGSLVCTKYNPKWEELSPKMRSVCKAYGKQIKRTNKVNKEEPGRVIAGRFTPERITRGKIVEYLRHQTRGVSLPYIAEATVADWNPKLHSQWIESILQKLEKDSLIQSAKKGVYSL